MTISSKAYENALLSNKTINYKQRSSKPKKKETELIQSFWLAPPEAYFDQFTIAPVTGRMPKTLECDRWKKSGIPFRKVGGRVLYRKADVVSWIESHELITSTSEYKKEVISHG